MVKAYILIHAEMGKGPAVSKAVSKVKGVTATVGVAGPYDVIAVVEAWNLDELATKVVAAIQAQDGVVRTLTCPVIHI
jgi:DNA-binding Lrp family transcriptional regulator